MELPFIDHLHVDQSKIVGYLLNETKSRGKAACFRRLGFRVEERAILAAALKAQARSHAVASMVESLWQTLQCGWRYRNSRQSAASSDSADGVDSGNRITNAPFDYGVSGAGANMIEEHESVVLTESLSDAGLVAGDVGVVVYVH